MSRGAFRAMCFDAISVIIIARVTRFGDFQGRRGRLAVRGAAGPELGVKPPEKSTGLNRAQKKGAAQTASE